MITDTRYLSVACKTCGAAPGEECRGTAPHNSRWIMAGTTGPETFNQALASAQEALTHIGTGEMRAKPIVREGPRSYESGGALEKKPPATADQPPPGYSVWQDVRAWHWRRGDALGSCECGEGHHVTRQAALAACIAHAAAQQPERAEGAPHVDESDPEGITDPSKFVPYVHPQPASGGARDEQASNDFDALREQTHLAMPAFKMEMEGRQYGEEALTDAWVWFRTGWDARQAPAPAAEPAGERPYSVERVREHKYAVVLAERFAGDIAEALNNAHANGYRLGRESRDAECAGLNAALMERRNQVGEVAARITNALALWEGDERDNAIVSIRGALRMSESLNPIRTQREALNEARAERDQLRADLAAVTEARDRLVDDAAAYERYVDASRVRVDGLERDRDAARGALREIVEAWRAYRALYPDGTYIPAAPDSSMGKLFAAIAIAAAAAAEQPTTGDGGGERHG